MVGELERPTVKSGSDLERLLSVVAEALDQAVVVLQETMSEIISERGDDDGSAGRPAGSGGPGGAT